MFAPAHDPPLRKILTTRIGFAQLIDMGYDWRSRSRACFVDVVESLQKELIELAHPAGGWGYAPGQEPHLEPTCLALLALKDESRLPLLNRFHRRDGSYRLDRGRDEAVWGTAMAVLAMHALGGDPATIRDSASFLLGVRGKQVQEDGDTDFVFDIDIQLVGWPWAEETFTWVEPTAWACLALQKLGQGDHPRVMTGVNVLLDRAFDAGGVNYGNKTILGKTTDPIPGTTATMLLAMQRRKTEPRVQAALKYVEDQARAGSDVEHLAQAKLALSLFDAGDLAWLHDRLFQQLDNERERAWAAKSPVRLSYALLALRDGKQSPFRVGDVGQSATMPEKTLVPTKLPIAERIRGGFRSLLARGFERMRQPPLRSVVHVARAESYDADLIGIVRQQYESFRDLVPLAGKRVVLKPNLVEYHPEKVINTDPAVIGAIVDLCRLEGAAEVIVAEGPGHWRNVQYLVDVCGLGEVLQRYKVQFVDLNHDEPMKLQNLGRLTGLEHLFVAQTVATADVLISLPKLKTHHWAGATLSLKNLFGVLPGICYGWPKNELHWRGIAESIIDIALTCTPHLALIDGIVGMEGDGPLNGTARPVGALVMGNDLVAVDAAGCRLMGLPATRITHIVLGANKRLGRIGPDGVEYQGEPIDSLAQKFELPPRFEKIALPA
jgi:uncharacterized protein (DUF362 family)